MEKEKKEYIDIELVKALMKSKGIDEKAMASLTGVTPQTIKKILSGVDQRNMSGDWPVKIAKALNVPAPVIFHRDYQ